MESYYSNELPFGYSDGYQITQGSTQSVFGMLLSVYLVIMTVIMILGIVNYVFKSMGLYTLAKRMGKPYPWLAWIPFARNYLHGDLAEVIPLKTTAIRHPAIWKLVVPIVGTVLNVVMYFVLLASIGVSNFFTGMMSHSYSSTGISAVFVFEIILFIGMQLIYQALNKTLSVMVNFQIIGRFTTRNMAIIHGVLSLFVPFYEALCLFLIREKAFNPGMEPEK